MLDEVARIVVRKFLKGYYANLLHTSDTFKPRYNAVVRVYDFRPRCMRGVLGVPISATRALLNNTDRRPLHQVQERCRSQCVLAAMSYTPIVYRAY